MRREVSSVLIFLFMLLAPLSYSSEAIPDFTPECSVTARHVSQNALAHFDGTTYLLSFPIVSKGPIYTISASVVPEYFWPKNTLFGRAPPF